MEILRFLSFHRKKDRRESNKTEEEKEEDVSLEFLQSVKFKKDLPKHILYQRLLRERYEKQYEINKGE